MVEPTLIQNVAVEWVTNKIHQNVLLHHNHSFFWIGQTLVPSTHILLNSVVWSIDSFHHGLKSFTRSHKRSEWVKHSTMMQVPHLLQCVLPFGRNEKLDARASPSYPSPARPSTVRNNQSILTGVGSVFQQHSDEWIGSHIYTLSESTQIYDGDWFSFAMNMLDGRGRAMHDRESQSVSLRNRVSFLFVSSRYRFFFFYIMAWILWGSSISTVDEISQINHAYITCFDGQKALLVTERIFHSPGSRRTSQHFPRILLFGCVCSRFFFLILYLYKKHAQRWPKYDGWRAGAVREAWFNDDLTN